MHRSAVNRRLSRAVRDGKDSRLRQTNLILTAFILCQAVQAVIAFTLCTNETTEREVCVAANDDLAVLIYVCNRNLHRAVVFCLNETTSGSALARNIEVYEVSLAIRVTQSIFSRLGALYTYAIVLHSEWL